MDIKAFGLAIAQIAEEKGLAREKIIESIETALAAAYKKEYGEKSQVIKAKMDVRTGKMEFWQVKTVVEPSMLYTDEELEQLKDKAIEASEEKIKFNPEKHVMLEDALKDNADIKINDEIKLPLEEKADFGRIAAQTAKQVIIQKIREAEKESIFQDFKLKEGEIMSGVIQRLEGKTVFMDIGKTLGILNREEQVMGEFYRPGQRLKVFIMKVEQTSKGPVIFLSRAYPKFVSKLFELEVPEIASGQVLIKSIAREAGSRTKIAVASTVEGIDPIGAAVGQRGTRVSAVINELGGEKIDIIEYSGEPEKYIVNALSPAKIMEVRLLPKNKALAIVPDDQLSLAIGKDGQNVRLAAKLSGWKIDVRSHENLDEEALALEMKQAAQEEAAEAERSAEETKENGEAKAAVEGADKEEELKEKKGKKAKKAKTGEKTETKIEDKPKKEKKSKSKTKTKEK
ncbi:MAG TPA: transcription termination factor NusA [Candidatus Paceibacterota bacterium]|nr:transcription termination factor NusA [Candidatus Pacearchaeota archaeon]HRZ51300.1 transcription termination factor NusA [Candidatus Paceibacterota bacterium]HSA37022.1 transcription termination factor NusA [Candidatus Paceibacterota bacterium]